MEVSYESDEVSMTYLDRSLPLCSYSGMELNLNRLPYDAIHVSEFGKEDAGVV
jgi:hypothetical protein